MNKKIYKDFPSNKADFRKPTIVQGIAWLATLLIVLGTLLIIFSAPTPTSSTETDDLGLPFRNDAQQFNLYPNEKNQNN